MSAVRFHIGGVRLGDTESIQRVSVSSSNVESVGYEPSERVLEVEFKDGSVYRYFGVPEGKYHNLRTASSVGGYLHEEIKEVYDYRQIR